jgi:hypothetical protein
LTEIALSATLLGGRAINWRLKTEVALMVDAQHRHYMNNYMKKYRQKRVKRDYLKMTHRIDSFKWRISKLLGPRYEILMCAQYDAYITTYDDYVVDQDLYRSFKKNCNQGGMTIFKVCFFDKWNRLYRKYNCCIVGILDKYALCQSFRELN